MSVERRHRNDDEEEEQDNNKLSFLKHPKFLLALYAAGIVGALIQILGGQWDLSWHVLGLVETFFTFPHTVLYSGVVFSLLSSLIALAYYHRILLFNRERNRFLLHGFIIALAGSGLQLFAGQFDYWWHDNFGFDPFLFTPSHMPLIIGFFLNGIGMWIGITYLIRNEKKMPNLALGESSSLSRRFKLLQILAVLSLVALWYDLSTLVYLFTDDEGIAYTFQLDIETFAEQADTIAFIISTAGTAAIGSIMLIGAKSTLKLKGAATVVAALLIGTSIAFDIGFKAIVLNGSQEGIAFAYFIPLYMSFLAPVVLFDILAGKKSLLTANKPKTTTAIGWLILTAVLLGPVGTLLDSWHSVALWIENSQVLLPWLMPMLAGGFAAGLIWIGFNKTLLNKLMTARGIPESADSGNSILPAQTKGSEKE
ncbi:MAG TPA: hypothetical protein VJ225_05715 [Nitrososphaeraceae archaeon]|nr:hypothetical protein [Nitrososphaeraceae archaeon]